ncbi:hypothetical protein EVAR_67239_1 [Eumeta japonica]|uniref:Uncharacterized protein n=1 Tax=Eumeta variegata TaxID=151549 RepID=A0A4C1YVW5_EUMVA|nr:hypothetical protein EVAR_67239_1 [Eumeta japonica]
MSLMHFRGHAGRGARMLGREGGGGGEVAAWGREGRTRLRVSSPRRTSSVPWTARHKRIGHGLYSDNGLPTLQARGAARTLIVVSCRVYLSPSNIRTSPNVVAVHREAVTRVMSPPLRRPAPRLSRVRGITRRVIKAERAVKGSDALRFHKNGYPRPRQFAGGTRRAMR